ncbi:hypothetical protein Gohar_023212 [Gossypium harknessii]|uniref:Splicing factor subunit n=1 Tax=Gossypium harknessii TaxID=34285 RepID=A0A7J9HC56_9ROSI|nr:hypothetical protein [Gossypium harknessii]
MQASDRFNINSQLEHLQAKYVGTGHADLNRFEWAVNIQRDSYASYIGHYPMLAYFAVAENESIGRERYNFMQFCGDEGFGGGRSVSTIGGMLREDYTYCKNNNQSLLGCWSSVPGQSLKCFCLVVCLQKEKMIKNYWLGCEVKC